jgi:hypothetical protein
MDKKYLLLAFSVLLLQNCTTEKAVTFNKIIINADSKFEAATFADLNNDGKKDIFCGSYWYQAPNWEKHFVRPIREETEYYVDFAAFPADVDGDGLTDIVGASWHDQNVYWLKNPGDTDTEWPFFQVDNPGNIETLIAADVNGDGIKDILPNAVRALVWYEYQSNSSADNGVDWTKHQLQNSAAGHGLGAGDINGDGRTDLIVPKGWLEQPEKIDDEWMWHKEFELPKASIPILVFDVENDGDADLIWGVGHGYGIYWMEQVTDAAGKRVWKQHEIDTEWSQAHFPILADVDLDGNSELVTGKRSRAHNGHDPGGSDPLCVYYYKYISSKKQWDRFVVEDNGDVGFGIYTSVEDIDGDGDVDILAPGKSGLFLMENLLK